VKSKAIERLLGAKPKCNHYYSQAVAKRKLHVHQSIATALKSETKKKDMNLQCAAIWLLV